MVRLRVRFVEREFVELARKIKLRKRIYKLKRFGVYVI